MKEFELTTSNLNTLDEVHNYLKSILSFPEYYGKNLDALYDILSFEIELPVKIIWKDYKKSEKKLGNDLKKISKVFRDVAKSEKQFKIQFD